MDPTLKRGGPLLCLRRNERRRRAVGPPGGGEVPLGRRRFGARRPPGGPGAQLGRGGRGHAATRRGHHHGGFDAERAVRERQRPRQAARAAAEPQPGRTAAGPAEAKTAPDALYPGSAQRAGAQLRQDPLPGHLHARGAGSAHRPHRVASPGMRLSHGKPALCHLAFLRARQEPEQRFPSPAPRRPGPRGPARPRLVLLPRSRPEQSGAEQGEPESLSL